MKERPFLKRFRRRLSSIAIEQYVYLQAATDIIPFSLVEIVDNNKAYQVYKNGTNPINKCAFSKCFSKPNEYAWFSLGKITPLLKRAQLYMKGFR